MIIQKIEFFTTKDNDSKQSSFMSGHTAIAIFINLIDQFNHPTLSCNWLIDYFRLNLRKTLTI